MLQETLVAWIGAGLAAAVGIGAWVFAGVANRHAKQANEIAKDSMAVAKEANRIAGDANVLAEEANALIGSERAARLEQWHVEWTIEWDQQASEVVLVNRGKDPGRDVHVVIRGDDLDHRYSHGENDVAAGGQIRIPLTQVPQKRVKALAQWQELLNAGYVGNTPHWEVAVTIMWRTGLDAPAAKTLKLRIN